MDLVKNPETGKSEVVRALDTKKMSVSGIIANIGVKYAAPLTATGYFATAGETVLVAVFGVGAVVFNLAANKVQAKIGVESFNRYAIINSISGKDGYRPTPLEIMRLARTARKEGFFADKKVQKELSRRLGFMTYSQPLKGAYGKGEWTLSTKFRFFKPVDMVLSYQPTELELWESAFGKAVLFEDDVKPGLPESTEGAQRFLEPGPATPNRD